MYQMVSAQVVKRVADETFIPLDSDNRDYRQFLEDWKNGADVRGEDGKPLAYKAT
jgi:hypothetical protein